MKRIWVGARSATILLDENCYFALEKPRALTLNGAPAGAATAAVTSLYGLLPGTRYTLATDAGDSLTFTTRAESATLNVRDFGAIGDGRADDTAAVQAALLCCPQNGRVLVPGGAYAVGPLFLKSHIHVELAAGATLLLATDRSRFPILPPLTDAGAPLGVWEGEPGPMYAALLNGIGVTDVTVYGSGVLDGQAQRADWWIDPRRMRGAWRGRMIYLARCRNVTVQGVTVQNSPSWNVHPLLSEQMKFLNLTVLAPADSPNTDGLNPESCRDVLIAGVRFSLGDDCIAVKTGKARPGKPAPAPCERIEVAHCLMENGHGGLTIGSEMSGGVTDVTVHHCTMRDTDRGLRVKTRRGRGGAVDHIALDAVRMERVKAPFTVNAFYSCDPDGRDPWVQDRAARPVDEGTPRVGALTFRNVTVSGCSACACYALGLPESRIESISMENVTVKYRPNAASFLPVMAEGVPRCAGKGIVAANVGRLALRGVRLKGPVGRELTATNVEQIEGEIEP